MTKEQLLNFICEECSDFNDQFHVIVTHEDWLSNRAVMTRMIETMDNLFEVYNKENQE